MIRRKGILALAAAGIVSMAASSFAAPVASLNLSAEALDGTPLVPGADGKILVAPGQEVKIVVSASVLDPNVIVRAGTQNGKALGLQVLTTSIVSLQDGTNVAEPKTDDAGSPPAVPPSQQQGLSYDDFTPHGAGYGFNNIIDIGGDGDMDLIGGGFAITQNSAPVTEAVYAQRSYGANESLAAFTSVWVFSLSPTGPEVTLQTQTSSAVVYRDPGSGVLAGDAAAAIVEGALTFVIPEPASLSLVGFGALGMLARRRRA